MNSNHVLKVFMLITAVWLHHAQPETTQAEYEEYREADSWSTDHAMKVLGELHNKEMLYPASKNKNDEDDKEDADTDKDNDGYDSADLKEEFGAFAKMMGMEGVLTMDMFKVDPTKDKARGKDKTNPVYVDVPENLGMASMMSLMKDFMRTSTDDQVDSDEETEVDTVEDTEEETAKESYTNSDSMNMFDMSFKEVMNSMVDRDYDEYKNTKSSVKIGKYYYHHRGKDVKYGDIKLDIGVPDLGDLSQKLFHYSEKDKESKEDRENQRKDEL